MGAYRVCLIVMLTLWSVHGSCQKDPRRLVFKQSIRVGVLKGIKTYRTKLIVDFRNGELHWHDSKMPRHFQWSKMKVHDLDVKLEDLELDTLVDALPFPRKPYRRCSRYFASRRDYKRKLTFGLRKIVAVLPSRKTAINEKEFHQMNEFIRAANRVYDRYKSRVNQPQYKAPLRKERRTLKIADKTYWMKG